MYLKSLTFENFGPFKGKQSIGLAQDVIFVQGIYLDNSQKSNRAGKSSFVEAILYVLFGKVRDDLKEIDLIHWGSQEMTVTATLIVNNEEITITRGRTASNKPILEITGIKGKKADKDSELQALLGLSADDFINTHFFKQAQIHGFMELPPAQKKKALQSWLNLDQWSNYELKAKNQLATFNNKLVGLESQRTTLNSQITQTDFQLSQINMSEEDINNFIQAHEMQLKASKDSYYSITKELDSLPKGEELQQSFNNLNLQFNQLQSKQAQVTNKLSVDENSKLAAINNLQKVEALKSQIKVSSTQQQELCNSLRIDFSSLGHEILNLQNKLKEKQPLYTKACSFTGICPVDNKECDKGSRIPDYKENLAIELETISKAISEATTKQQNVSNQLTNEWNTYLQAKDIEDKINKFSQNSDPSRYEEIINIQKEKLTELGLELTKINNELMKINEQIKNVDTTAINNLKLKQNEELLKQKDLTNKIAGFNRQLGMLNQLKQSKSKLEMDLLVLGDGIKQVKKDQLRWTYIASMFGKDGIPSILVENSLEYIEEFANIILGSISPQTRMEFETTKEISTKETHCNICGSPFGAEKKCGVCGFGFKRNKVKDEINLVIYENGERLKFGSDSGGGKVLISMALRLALSKLLSNRANKCEFLVLDEVFGALDSVNREVVSRMVFNALKNLMGFRQIFVITHTPLGNYSHQTITIKRNGKFSEIST